MLSDKTFRPGQPFSLAEPKNPGNIRYFNALIQTLFRIEELAKAILSFYPPYDINKALTELKVVDPTMIQRKNECVSLVLSLQKLFASMLYPKKEALNPSEIMKIVANSQGKKLKVGEELDINEFFMNFFVRIYQGLQLDSRPKSDEEQQKSQSTNITDLFFGESKDFITCKWSGDITVKKDHDSLFGPVNLNTSCGDFMVALEGYMECLIEGYKGPDGEITTAKKQVWITKPPQILTFGLQSVEYDRKKGLVKKNNLFTFPKEIYLDRFLYGCKKEMKHVFEQLKELKKKDKKIDQGMSQLLGYKDTVVPLKDILECISELLADELEEIEKGNTVEEYKDAAELKKTRITLESYRENVINRMTRLEEAKERIKKKLEKVFQDLQKVKYVLHSIVVNEDEPESGDYYSYIYNDKKNKWMKSNDSKVTEVSEEEVFQISSGERDGSACCLFYAKEDCKMMNYDLEEREDMKKLLPINLRKMFE